MLRHILIILLGAVATQVSLACNTAMIWLLTKEERQRFEEEVKHER